MDKKAYRRFLYMMAGNAVCLLFCALYLSCWHKIPATIKIRAGQLEKINFSMPASGTLKNADDDIIPVSLDKPLTFYANEKNSYGMEIKLFGVLPLKQVKVQVIPDRKLIPAGVPVGIYVKTDGVLVVGTGEFTGYDGVRHSPAQPLLKSGDYILRMNGEEVTGKRMFMSKLQEIGEKDLVLTIRRNDSVFDVKTNAISDRTGIYKIGIWVRDNAQGVGTMTYMDAYGNFGALGHGINDMDTSELMLLKRGMLYHTDIVGITKGEAGRPGELTGMIDYSENNIIGQIVRNENQGIFGVCTQDEKEEIKFGALPIALKQEVHKGPAKIMCSLDGRETKLYDMEITDITYDTEHVNREIMLHITDAELINRTGGIIQGMSGCPIIQDGKLAGAVTHVFVQDATKGYGIFIENMLEE